MTTIILIIDIIIIMQLAGASIKILFVCFIIIIILIIIISIIIIILIIIISIIIIIFLIIITIIIMQVAEACIKIFFVLYLSRKSKILVARLCPRQNRSCIGKYGRNAIDYRQTSRLSVALSLIFITNAVKIALFYTVKLAPQTVFLLDSMEWIILCEIPFLCVSMVLMVKEMPKKVSHQNETPFYVHMPGILVPRRPPNEMNAQAPMAHLGKSKIKSNNKNKPKPKEKSTTVSKFVYLKRNRPSNSVVSVSTGSFQMGSNMDLSPVE